MLEEQRGAEKEASQLVLRKGFIEDLESKLGFRSVGWMGEGLTGMRTMPVWVVLPTVGKEVELEG